MVMIPWAKKLAATHIFANKPHPTTQRENLCIANKPASIDITIPNINNHDIFQEKKGKHAN